MSEMVERLAKIMHDHEEIHGNDSLSAFRAVARDIIAAMREPTDAMVSAGFAASMGTGCVVEWQAMIDAALAAEPMTAPASPAPSTET